TITVIRGVIAKVHQSHNGTAELNEAKTLLQLGRGLITIGKTRFGTIISSAESVQRNLPAIRRVVQHENYSFGDEIDCCFQELSGGRPTKVAADFVTGLGRLVDIGKPALKALTFLEANEASPGDVYVFWHASLQAMRHVLTDPGQDIPLHVRDEIIGILNHRHDQIFGEGNLSDSADLYLSGAYLHP
ncbi:hypothetical protein DXG01_014928, partial [Tephrocybe rancida]